MELQTLTSEEVNAIPSAEGKDWKQSTGKSPSSCIYRYRQNVAYVFIRYINPNGTFFLM